MKKSFTPIARGRSTALEIASLKRYFHLLPFMFFVCCTLLIASCEEKDKVSPDDDPDIEEPDVDIDPDTDGELLDIPVSKGHIGLVLDTRSIAKKGYKPAYASVIIDGDLSSFSQNHIEIDEFTNLATLRISKDSISENVLDQFIRGANLDITVYDENNEVLSKRKEKNHPINASAKPMSLKTEKPKINPPLKIIEGAAYKIIAEPVGEHDKGGVLTYTNVPGGYMHFIADFINDPFNIVGQDFTFLPAGNDSTFYIKAGNSYYAYGASNRMSLYDRGKSTPPEEYRKFVLTLNEDGLVTIKHKNSEPYGVDNNTLTFNLESTKETRFRLILADIKWQAQDVGIALSKPIMPPAKIEFAINSPITNCADATITQTVGKEEVRTTTISVGTEESFSVTTTHEARVDASVSVGVNADLFGVVGVEKNYSLSAGYTYTDTESSTSTSRFEATNTTETRVSFMREILVEPYKILNVYDVVQTYENIKMPYVQKLRVSATYEGKALTGEEITLNLMANQFGGVVAETGSNYVIITVKGMVEIQNLMEARTETTELPCPNKPK